MKEILSNANVLIKKIRQEQDTYRNVVAEDISINIYNQKEKSMGGSQSNDSRRFTWTYSFIHALTRLSESLPSSIGELERHQLMEKLKLKYSNNSECLKKIAEFEEHYSCDEAIRWYTSDSIVYKELNRSLRENDFNWLLSFRFFIVDIYRQLQQEYTRVRKTADTTSQTLKKLRVYRAQCMPSNVVMRLKNSINGYVSMSSFLSTSLRRQMALEFIKHMPKFQKELIPALLEIEIDQNLTTLPYAEISDYSEFSSEEEVLFSPGIIFKIDGVDDDRDDQMCVVHLKLGNENERDLEKVLSVWKQNHESQTSLESFGRLIIQTGQLDEAEDFYNMLLKNLSQDDSLIRDCWNGLGNIYREKNQSATAISHHRLAISASKHRNDYQKWVAHAYDDLADAYSTNEEPECALKYYEKASKKFQKLYTKPHLSTIMCYTKIGRIYQHHRDYKKALESLEKALELIKEIDLIEPQTSIEILKHISQCHYLNCQFDRALEYASKVLITSKTYFRTNDPEIGCAHEDIGDIHLERGDLISALSSYHKAAKKFYYSFPQKDQHNADIQHLIKCCNIKLK